MKGDFPSGEDISTYEIDGETYDIILDILIKRGFIKDGIATDIIICPECGNEMDLLETWDSLLSIARWHKYGCEYCGGIFEVKRAKKGDENVK